MNERGVGLGRVNGGVVFVPHTAVGDVVAATVVKQTRSYRVAHLDEIITPAPCRIAPDCAVCRACGGCTYRHMTYAAECAVKQKRVNDCLRRIGGFSLTVEELLPSPTVDRYRNKAQLPVGRDAAGRPAVGFYAPHSHRIIPLRRCLLQPEKFDRLAAAFVAALEEANAPIYNEETGQPGVRHLCLRTGFATGETLACICTVGPLPNAHRYVQALRAAEPTLTGVLHCRNDRPTNVVLAGETRLLYGRGTYTDRLLGVPFTLSLPSFYQVNSAAAERLFLRAGEYAAAKSGQTVVDLYCGAGAVGLSAAPNAGRLIGVEVVPSAVEDARRNAAAAGRQNAEFWAMDAAEAGERLAREGIKPDVVFVDPPRKGCAESLLRLLAGQICPDRLVYISCDPATLSRDAALLARLGYALRRVTAVDLFPRTPHVESVALFTQAAKGAEV